MAKIFVTFEFVNKQGKKKRVRFPMDKQSYEAYHAPSVPAEWTQKMMLEDYKEYCAQKRYEKKTCRFPVDEDGNDIDFPDSESTSIVEKIENKEEENVIVDALKKLSTRQREAFCLVHLEGMRPATAARMMGIKQATISEYLSKAEKTIEEDIGKKIF